MADEKFTRAPNYPFLRPGSTPDAGSRARNNDPLSELARLIGQNDPFAEPAAPPLPPQPAQRSLREILAAAREPEPDDSLAVNNRSRDPLFREPPPSDSAPRDDFRRDDHWASPGPHDHQPPPLVPDYRDEASRDDFARDEGYRDETDGALDHGRLSGSSAAYPGDRAYDDDHGQQIPSAHDLNSELSQQNYLAFGQGHDAGPYYDDEGRLLPENPSAQPLPQDEFPEELPRRRGGLITVAAVLALAVLGTAGAYVYRTFLSGTPGFPPLIRADNSLNKIVPAQGEAGPAKQIYDRVGGDSGQGEKVVSREEKPVDVRPAGTRMVYPGGPVQSGPAAGQQSSAPPAWPSPPGTPQAVPAGAARNQPAAPVPNSQSEPRKVRTIPIRPDQQGAASPSAPAPLAEPAAAPPPAPRTAVAAAPEPSPPARPAASRPASTAGGPLSLNPRGGGEDAAPAASRTMAAAAPRAAVPAAPAGQGGYVVQLSAQRSQEEAVASFQSFQGRYPSLLGGQQMIIRRKEIEGKGTFFGAQAGPFASQAEAAQLCSQLKAAGAPCMVQKN